jgi:hypothetical protein
MDLAVVNNVKVVFLLHSVEMIEIFIKQEGKFLDITRVPAQLKLRSGLGNYLYIRDCYEVIIANIRSPFWELPALARVLYFWLY